MGVICRDCLKLLLPNSHHQRCVAHILNLVGGDLLNSEILTEVKKLQLSEYSFIKGKKKCLPSPPLASCCPKCPARSLSNQYSNGKWLNENLGALKAFVTIEIANGSMNTQMIEVKCLLEKDFATLSLIFFFLSPSWKTNLRFNPRCSGGCGPHLRQ